MSSPNQSKFAIVFAGFTKLVLTLTHIGILIVLSLMLREIHLIFKELEKIITGDNYIRVGFIREYGSSSTSPWYVEIVQ